MGLAAPALVVDGLASAGPLILYSALGAPGDTPVANVLRARKVPTGVEVTF